MKANNLHAGFVWGYKNAHGTLNFTGKNAVKLKVERLFMFHASLRHTIEHPWLGMEPYLIAADSVNADGTPAAYITVEQNGQPFARIDARLETQGAFTELIVWHQYIVLGWGSHVHLVDPDTRSSKLIECDGYFGHLYPLQDFLLVTSASELICVDSQRNVKWKNSPLGIDGVMVDCIKDGVIFGEGE